MNFDRRKTANKNDDYRLEYVECEIIATFSAARRTKRKACEVPSTITENNP